MKMNKIVLYFVYAIVIYAALFAVSSFVADRKIFLGILNPSTYIIVRIRILILFALVGGMLGIEHILREIKNSGKWKLNTSRLIILGLCAVIFPFVCYSLKDLLYSRYRLLLEKNLLVFSGFFLGYMLMTSFKKVDINRADKESPKILEVKQSIRKTILYLVYGIVIFTSFFVVSLAFSPITLNHVLTHQPFMSWSRSVSSAIFSTFNVALFALIGGILGVEHILKESKNKGKWKVNISRLIILGLPSLYFAFFTFTYFHLGFYKLLLNKLLLIVVLNQIYYGTFFDFGLLLGYIVITSFNKVNMSQSDEESLNILEG